jgi:hypothetical protein
LVGGADHQSTPQHVVGTERPRPVQNGTLAGKDRQCLADSRTDHDHLCLSFKQSLYFTPGDLAATDDQATFTL